MHIYTAKRTPLVHALDVYGIRVRVSMTQKFVAPIKESRRVCQSDEVMGRKDGSAETWGHVILRKQQVWGVRAPGRQLRHKHMYSICRLIYTHFQSALLSSLHTERLSPFSGIDTADLSSILLSQIGNRGYLTPETTSEKVSSLSLSVWGVREIVVQRVVFVLEFSGF